MRLLYPSKLIKNRASFHHFKRHLQDKMMNWRVAYSYYRLSEDELKKRIIIIIRYQHGISWYIACVVVADNSLDNKFEFVQNFQAFYERIFNELTSWFFFWNRFDDTRNWFFQSNDHEAEHPLVQISIFISSECVSSKVFFGFLKINLI